MTSAIGWTEPSTRSSILWITPLALWFGAASFLPASITPKLYISDIPIPGSDVLLLAIALFYASTYICSARSGFPPKWHNNLPLWFAGILSYAAVSLLWAGLDTSNSRAMFYTLLLASAAFLLPLCTIASVTANEVWSLARLLSFGLAAISAAYAIESILSLGLRSEL